MQYTEQELSQLIKSLETEFSAHIADVTGAAQPASLAKAEDEKPAEKKDESKDEAPADKEESKPEAKESKEEPKDAPAAEAKEAKPEGEEAAPAAPAEEAPVAPSADEGASGYDAEDIAHMDQMYMSMSKAELLAHHDSCVRALDAIGAEHTHAAAPAAEQAAPAAPAAEAQAPAAEIDKCGDMSMSKSEPNAELELAKSEAAAAKAEAEKLAKNLAGVQEFLTALVKKVPQGKAITQYEQVQKSENAQGEVELSKSEINAKLLAKSQDPKLSKTDRDAINAFYLNQANFNTISHLLK